MGFLHRDRRTLNERLIDDLESESEVRTVEADETVVAEPMDDVEATGSGGYWDVVVDAVDSGLLEDSYEFASLATGDLIVEESVEESLSSLADAVDPVLEGPYRAVAVRQGPEWWTVSARRSRSCRSRWRASARGSSARAAGFELELDGQPGRGRAAAAQLAALAADLGDDFVVDATTSTAGCGRSRRRHRDVTPRPRRETLALWLRRRPCRASTRSGASPRSRTPSCATSRSRRATRGSPARSRRAASAARTGAPTRPGRRSRPGARSAARTGSSSSTAGSARAAGCCTRSRRCGAGCCGAGSSSRRRGSAG